MHVILTNFSNEEMVYVIWLLKVFDAFKKSVLILLL